MYLWFTFFKGTTVKGTTRMTVEVTTLDAPAANTAMNTLFIKRAILEGTLRLFTCSK